MAWNATDRLHQLLWSAPRSKALVERLGEIDDQMITDLEWHLVRFGHDPEVARLRAQLVVTTIEAVVHSQPVQGDRVRQAAELVDLCAGYIELR
jgi:hypothetical protein